MAFDPSTAELEKSAFDPSTAKIDDSGLDKKRSEKYDPEVKSLDYIWNKAKAGFVNGTLGLGGLLADIGNPMRIANVSIRNYLSDEEDIPYLGITQKATEFGDDMLNVDREMLPPDALTRYAGAVTEFGTGSVIPGAAVVRTSTHPLLAAASEAAAVATGGVGAELGGDIAEEIGVNRAWGEMPGGIVTGQAGYAVPALTSKLIGGAKALDNAVASTAGKEIGGIVSAENTGGDIVNSFKTADEIESVTGQAFNPTLSGRTKSTILNDLEQEVLGRDIASAERAIKTQNKNVQNLQDYKDSIFPNKGDITKPARDKIALATRNINEEAELLSAEMGTIGSKAVGRDQQAVGEDLYDLMRVKREAAKSASNTEINRIYALADNAGIKESMDEVVDVVKIIAGDDANSFQKLPPVFAEIKNKYMDKTSPIFDAKGKPIPQEVTASFQEMHSLYKEVNRQLTAARGIKDQTSAFFLSKVKDAIQSKLRKIEDGKGEVSNAFRAWNKEYSNYASAYKEGVGGRMAATGKYGDLLVKENIFKKFFTPTGLDDFNAIYKGDPTAQKFLDDAILNEFASRTGVLADGKINTSAARNFIKNNMEALNKMPQLRDTLLDNTKATNALLERNARLIDAKKLLDKSILVKIAETDDPIPLIEKALTNRKQLSQLMSLPGKSRESALNLIAQALPSAANKNRMTVSQFLDANSDIIRPVLNKYGKNHYKNVKTIADAMDMLSFSRPPQHPSLTQFSTDPIQQWTGTSGPSLISQYRATTLTRQSSPIHMASSMGTRFWMKLKGDDAKRMQEYILTNPDAARNFATALSSQSNTFVANRLRYHAMAAGIRSFAVATEDMSEQKQVVGGD